MILALPALSAASKPQTSVQARWDAPAVTTAQGAPTDLNLHVTATSASPAVLIEVLLPTGVSLVSGTPTWTGALAAGEDLSLPITVSVAAPGDWPIGARVTSVRTDGTEISGAVVYAIASGEAVQFTADHPATVHLRAAASLAEQRRFGVAPVPVGQLVPTPDASLASTVTGTVTWRDPEGNVHPVRRALVGITDASSAVLALTSTSDAGTYTAAVNAASVTVTVYSQDSDDTRARVFPLNQPLLRYTLASALTSITGATTTINLTTTAPVRGTPGSPSADSIGARAFAVYDGMLTFWFQASAMIGAPMQAARAHFPESTAPGGMCGTSCYSSGTQQMYILREDAYDWDVLGHEFFHFATNRASLRPIDTSLGGSHNGGSAIGQNDGTGHLRTRDEGMRLAWSEGLATAEGLLLQVAPASPFAFPNLANVADNSYQDTEDGAIVLSAETPSRSDGFGSENSVLGLLWDLYDVPEDSVGSARDAWSGVGPGLIWQAINSILPVGACDRVDRFWVGIVNLFGITNPAVLQIAPLLAINNISPVLGAPADNASVGGSAAPTFTWTRNGDPSGSHRSSEFYLVFSRDNFQGHLVVIPAPADATSYQPTDAEWASVQAGGAPGQAYRWFVAAKRPDAPDVPTGWFWYSDIRTFVPRSIEAIITWAPLGADVDLHLSNPSGTDIAYYNLSTGWGFLDRDCITSCTREVLSVASLPLTGAYRLWVDYYSDHGRGPATVRAVVRSGSSILIDRVFVLGATGAEETLAAFSINPLTGELVGESAPTPTTAPYLPPKRPGSR